MVTLRRHDYSPTAAKHLYVPRALLAQKVHHELKELYVTTLVTRYRDAVCVFLHCRVYDFRDGPVVPKVHYLTALILENASNDADGGIVPVEKRGGSHEPHGRLDLGHHRQNTLD
nr:hypothetical protein NCPCFENI_00479 [Cupriavidus sp.]